MNPKNPTISNKPVAILHKHTSPNLKSISQNSGSCGITDMSLLLAFTTNFAFKLRLPTKNQDRFDNETIKRSNDSSKNKKGNRNLFIASLYPYCVSYKSFDIR